MFIKDIKFNVLFSEFAEKHFCKKFLKDYKPKAWLITKKSIVDILERAFAFQKTNLIDPLKFSQEDNIGISKLDFKVAGTNTSPKSSGNRVVFTFCNDTGEIEILIVYGKKHCSKNNETQWILQKIKDNFPQYKKYCL